MATKIFVNLPVKSLPRAVEFFTKLGYAFNPQFTNENATCMIISESIYAMLLVEPFFQTFITKKKIADARETTEAIVALSHDDKKSVVDLVEKAKAAGAKPLEQKDLGFMFQWGFEDLDGHIWEHFYMDASHVQK